MLGPTVTLATGNKHRWLQWWHKHLLAILLPMHTCSHFILKHLRIPKAGLICSSVVMVIRFQIQPQKPKCPLQTSPPSLKALRVSHIQKLFGWHQNTWSTSDKDFVLWNLYNNKLNTRYIINAMLCCSWLPGVGFWSFWPPKINSQPAGNAEAAAECCQIISTINMCSKNMFEVFSRRREGAHISSRLLKWL